MKYIVNYYFDGNGSVEVEAESMEQATDLFMEGLHVDIKTEQEWGENYEVATVEAK